MTDIAQLLGKDLNTQQNQLLNYYSRYLVYPLCTNSAIWVIHTVSKYMKYKEK